MGTTIALDAMGGDHGPSVVVPAALQVLREHPELSLLLVGRQDALEKALEREGAAEGPRLRIHHASQVVAMDELPSSALRTKKDSSMRVAVNLVKEGVADACVSAGNTGALMATARFVLKTLPGIHRPAIISPIPTLHGHTHMLDLGANSDCTPEHLFQFAVMGSMLVRVVDNIPHPRVALLNIGEEEIKGTERVKEAARLISQSDLNYIGYIEGHDIYRGVADVVVCDGFVGNVALKASEGVAMVVRHYMQEAFRRNLWTRMAGLVASPVLRSLARKMDARRYNGASFLGVRGIVIKSHGGADALAFAHAIEVAALETRKGLLSRITGYLKASTAERQAV
ncbi:MAG: phosphate acyltransferase PlsX [Gammaproteobacteria bacterium]|nr:MAG: phosphate acyltransferase PlsX [Gammaproteobacteria bacterium]